MTQPWDAPRKFVIIATPRSGGTFLCHCLDSHPDIGCERDEPLRFKAGVFESNWVKEFGQNYVPILRAVLNRPGYLVTCARVNYHEFRLMPEGFWRSDEIKFIHLYRKNPIRAVVSSRITFLINRGELAHPVHAYETPHEPAKIELDPADAVKVADEYYAKVEATREALTGLGGYHELHYEQLVANDGRTLEPLVGVGLCKYMDVPWLTMSARLQRVNPWPLAEIVTNWPDVRKAFEASQWAKFLEGEE